MLKPNTQAPDFKLPDQNGEYHRLSQYKGQWILIYFYPKDDTPGCTKEACAIRDNYNQFQKHNIKVLGISADTIKKHKQFEQKYQLPFTLLSDETKDTIQNYQAWGLKKFMGREYEGIFRHSYLIDQNGIIQKIYPKVNPTQHAQEILEDYQITKKS